MKKAITIISFLAVTYSNQARPLLMAKSNQNEGIDITHFIKNPTFETSHQTNSGSSEGWTVEPGTGSGNITPGPIKGDGDTFLEKCGYYNACFESWHRYDWDVWQEITGLPVGMYELEVQGYVSCEVAGYNKGDELGEDYPSPVYLYMNNAMSQFPSVYSEIPAEHGITMTIVEAWTQEEINGNWFPNSMGGATQCLYGGMYKIKVNGEIANEGDKLRIGVRMNAVQDNHKAPDWWCIWDNFKLTYYGDDPIILKYELNAALESINLDAPMGKSVYNSAKRLVDMANEAIAAEDGNAMSQILIDLNDISDDITNSIALFANLIDEIENNVTGLIVVISNSMNNKAKEEATALANSILSDIENHNIEDSEVEELLNQISAMKDRLNMCFGGVYYNFITKAKLAEVISNPNNKYSGSITIPETVEYEGNIYTVITIKEDAFSGCSGVTSISIPNSVTSIGKNAFSGCNSLSSITIPNSITSIDNNVFSGCKALNSVFIPNSVTKIGNNAFEQCTGLKNVTIPNSVTSIGSSAFRGCSTLSEVDIPNSVTSIGGSVFSGCTNLTGFSLPNSVSSIGEGLFDGCTSLKSIIIPSTITEIGDYAFYNCSGLENITIPSSIIGIGYKAFSGCNSLSTVSFNCKNIGDWFKGNSSIKNVTICNGVINIWDSAFQGCTGLLSITFPNSVTSIGNNAFSGCSGLISISIPNSVTRIGNNAFSGCSGLISLSIPNSISTIGNNAFSGCNRLASIAIGSNIIGLGNTSFANCPEITDVYCYAERVPNAAEDTFKDSYAEYATLHVPAALLEDYMNATTWKNFNVVALDHIKGDANGDSEIDTKDISEVANAIVGQLSDEFKNQAADYNNDGIIDITDITDIIESLQKKTYLIPAEHFPNTETNEIPNGFVVMFGDEERNSGKSYSSGPRIFEFASGGDFTKGLYIREGYAQYGGLENYPLTLEAGKQYKIHFNTAMWKDNGSICRFEILTKNEESVLAQMINNTPNVNGNNHDPIYGSTSTDVIFTPQVSGNYLLRWTTATDETSNPGFFEILLGNVWMRY